MFREEFSAEISSRRDIYGSIKARYPAGLSQISNGVYVPLSFTFLKVVSLQVNRFAIILVDHQGQRGELASSPSENVAGLRKI